jgi:hypothetical protein
MDFPSKSHMPNENDLRGMVTPGTVSAVILRLREEVDETLALAASLSHPPSVADLVATAEALQRDIHALEKIAAAWQQPWVHPC